MTYYNQETDYTCAIASLRMCFSAFNPNFAESKTESELAFLCDAKPEYGTQPKKLVEVAKSFAFDAEYVKDGSIEEVRQLKKDGWEIILMISVDVPHCVVYLGDDNNHIFYNDPWFGENWSCRLKKFLSENQRYPFARWFVETKSLEKYYPDLDLTEVKRYEGVRQYIKIKAQ